MRKTAVYLIEKSTGLLDENGVELWYSFSARLTKGKAEEDFEHELNTREVRIRKMYATK